MLHTPVWRLAAALAADVALATWPSHAQDLPNKRILLIAALAAGTGLDIVARTLAERLSQRIGQPVIVENKPGSAGLAAADSVQRAEPDGATRSWPPARPCSRRRRTIRSRTSCRSRSI